MTEIKSYRKKPVTIQGVRWNGTKESADAIVEWIERNDGEAEYLGGNEQRILINTLEGWVGVKPDDYVMRGLKGEFYPHAGGHFDEAFDPAEEIVFSEVRHELSEEIIDAVREEARKAHAKHYANGGSIFDPAMPEIRKLAALMEETGEVGRALTYDGGARTGDDTSKEHLILELIQTACVALTWADCLSDQLEGDV